MSFHKCVLSFKAMPYPRPQNQPNKPSRQPASAPPKLDSDPVRVISGPTSQIPGLASEARHTLDVYNEFFPIVAAALLQSEAAQGNR